MVFRGSLFFGKEWFFGRRSVTDKIFLNWSERHEFGIILHELEFVDEALNEFDFGIVGAILDFDMFEMGEVGIFKGLIIHLVSMLTK